MSEERNCAKCKHKKIVRIPIMGFCEEACELWDCKFEPKEGEDGKIHTVEEKTHDSNGGVR